MANVKRARRVGIAALCAVLFVLFGILAAGLLSYMGNGRRTKGATPPPPVGTTPPQAPASPDAAKAHKTLPQQVTVPPGDRDSHSSVAVEKVKAVRSLVERALRSSDDPEGAKKLLVEACKAFRELPAGANYEEAVILFDPDEVSLAHLRPTKTTVVKRKRDLSGRLTIIEKHVVNEYPFSGMVDNNKGFIAPIPSTTDVIDQQILELDGKEVYATNQRAARTGSVRGLKDYHVSPDHRFVVLEAQSRSGPIEILNLGTGEIVQVRAPKEFSDHDYVYPFGFVGWSKGSKRFTVEVTGTYVKKRRTRQSGLTAYRELWEIDAETCEASQMKRQEKPWERHLTWE